MWKRMIQLSNGSQAVSPDERVGRSNVRPSAVVEPLETGAPAGGLDGKREPALLVDFEQVYLSSAARPPRLPYGVLKVAEMLHSPHLCGMPTDAKRAALLMALEAGEANMEDILQDAIIRQRILNEYEEARRKDLQRFEAAIQEENRVLQAEMDRLSSQYMARMQSNLDDLSRVQDNFRA